MMRILLTSIFLISSVSIFAQVNDRRGLLFDGLYETACEKPDEEEGEQNYLRFYSDGKVISAGTDCEGSADDLKDWFYINSGQVSSGKYTLTGNKIEFSTISPTGTVVYEGTVVDKNVIKLKWRSLINDANGEDVYKFVRVRGLK